MSLTKTARGMCLGLVFSVAAGILCARAATSQLGPLLLLALVGGVALVLVRGLTRLPIAALATLLLFAGYAIFNRSFAEYHLSLGQVPLYIGEMVLLLALPWALSQSAECARLSRQPFFLALAVWIAYCAVRLLAGGLAYGVDALRDSAVWYYGLFSIIGYVLWSRVRPGVWMRFFVGVFLAQALVTAAVALAGPFSLPFTDPTVQVDRADVMAVNLIGGATFFLLALRAARLQGLRILLATFELGLVPLLQVRAATIGVLAVLAVLGIQRRWSTLVAILVVPAVALGALAITHIEVDGLRGPVSANAVIERQLSTVSLMFEGKAASEDPLEDTAAWRLYWWNTLLEQASTSLHTALFGVGFGPNLTDVVGYNQEDPLRPLRSPHNIVMTVFARTGLFGLGLWLLVQALWFQSVVRGLRTRTQDSPRLSLLADSLLWLTSYALAILVAALFGVVLEGPYGGIPYFLLLGLGVRRAEELAALKPAAEGVWPRQALGGTLPAPVGTVLMNRRVSP